jgi:hypothetical protein
MNANILAIKHGLKSRTEVVAEQGRDLADVWADLAEEQKQAEAAGIVLADLAEAEAADVEDEPPAAEEPEDDEMRAAVLAALTREPPQPVVNVTVQGSETTIRNEVQPTPVEVAAPAVTVENRVEPAAVNVEAPKVEVRNEVTAPEYVEVETKAQFDKAGRMTGTKTVKKRA